MYIKKKKKREIGKVLSLFPEERKKKTVYKKLWIRAHHSNQYFIEDHFLLYYFILHNKIC